MSRAVPRPALVLLCLTAGALALAQGLPPGNGPASPNSAINEPTAIGFSNAMLSKLKLPLGFKVGVFAQNLANARMMLVRANGDVYLTRRAQGDVLLLRDKNRDGAAEGRAVVAQNLKWVHGIAEHNNKLYLATDRSVLVSDIRVDGSLSRPRPIITDLPDGGQHPNRTLAFGPDGYLYITVGSTCNACNDANPENATILRSTPDGRARTVFARGLRNTIGFGWHPVSKALYGLDHGSDWRGDDQPPEEINRLEPGRDYGWPWCFAERRPDPYTPGAPQNTTKEAYCARTEAPRLTYTAHSAPIGMTFYSGQMFPAEYRNDAFVAMRGSWNRSSPSGYKIVRLHFSSTGNPESVEDFVTGWLIDPATTTVPEGPATTPPEQQQQVRPAQFGRVAGVAQWTDGSLLVSEDQNGVVYRISYGGAR